VIAEADKLFLPPMLPVDTKTNAANGLPQPEIRVRFPRYVVLDGITKRRSNRNFRPETVPGNLASHHINPAIPSQKSRFRRSCHKLQVLPAHTKVILRIEAGSRNAIDGVPFKGSESVVKESNASIKSQLLELETRLFGVPLEKLWILTAYDPRVHRIRKVFESRYTEHKLSITDISADCGMTVSNLNRMMVQLTGRTTYQLLISFRILQSIHEALRVNSSFADIARHNGFDNSASYSRTVRRVLGWPPSKLIPRGAEFRRELNLPSLEQRERSSKPATQDVDRWKKADL